MDNHTGAEYNLAILHRLEEDFPIKKLLAALLALILLRTPALATAIPSGTFTLVDPTSGLAEYASPLGYRLLLPYQDMFSVSTYHDSEFFTAVDYSEGEISMSVVRSAIPGTEAEAFLGEAIGCYQPEYVSDVSEGVAAGGNTTYSLLTTTDGVTNIFCAVTNGPETLMITVTYPEIESESCFDLFNAMLTSIEF